jgi:PAS domain S-box-containing protein
MGTQAERMKRDRARSSENNSRNIEGNEQWLLASIVGSSDDAIMSKTLDGVITSWNPAAEQVYGYNAGEIVGKPVSILLHKDRPDEMSNILEKIRDGKRIEHYETVRVKKDGSAISVSLTVSPIHDANGKIIGASSIARDISERKRAEERARTTSQYARSLIEASLDPLVTISPDGKITDVNEGSIKITGVPREKLIGTDFSDYFTEPEKARKGYREAFSKGSVTDYPLTIRHKGGRMTNVLYNATVYKDEEGKVLGVFAAARDVTAQNQASQYARSLIEASLDPLVTISPEGKITDVNEGSIKVTGVPRDKLIGTDFSDYFTEPEMARAGYQQVFAKGFVTDYPLTIRHKDGRLTDVLYNASVYKDADGNVLGVFAAARDVTAQKQASQYARSLIEASLDPLVTISAEGKITDVNEGSVKVTGVPRERLIGTDFSNYFTEPSKAREGYQQVFAKGFVTDYPLTIRHKEGRQTDVLYNASVYKDGNGNVLGVFAAARDVTAQKQASQYARSLIEASLDPLVTISPEGKITDVNEGSIKVTGVPREELVGTDFSNYFTEPEKAREGYKQVFARGFVTDYPLTIRHKDGRQTDVLYNASVYKDANGNVLGVFAAARDVTAQKQASQYARSLIEASLDPLVTISPEGKITDVNEATVKVTGVMREKLIGTDFSNYFTEPEKAREGYQQVFARGFVTDYPLTIRHKDGGQTDVLYNASVYKDANGNVLGVFAAARDVTEQKRVMREFAETKNLLDNILQSSIKYSIIGKDLDHRILSWNEGARRNYGYAANEILGRNSEILHAPEDVKSGAVQKLLDRAYKEGLAEGEFVRTRKDGSRFAASVVITRRNDASGNPVGYLLMSSDISEKKQAEEQLLSASQYARSLIEASLDPLVTISPEGKITDVNEGSIKVTGVPREKLIGTDFSDYFTEPEKAREGYQEAFSKGSVTDYPLTIRHKDGRLTDVLYNASVYKDADGNVLGVFAAARDVTAQKQASQYSRSLIEASVDPLVTISPEGKITDVNEATIKVTGVSREDLVGADFSNYFTEPDKAREGYQQVFAKGSVTDYPLTIRHRNRKLTEVLYNASVYKDARGNVLGVFAAARDVTAQKKAEAEIAEQRSKELERLAELERFQKLTVGRELKMIELKQEIEDLKKRQAGA